MITTLLEGTKKFVAETFEKEKEFFAELAKDQKPTVLWIGCSDSRVPVNTITQTRAGEVFTHRNVGNIVATNDWNLSAVLEFSINHLRIPDVVICGHYGCGGMAALDEEYRGQVHPGLADQCLQGEGAGGRQAESAAHRDPP